MNNFSTLLKSYRLSKNLTIKELSYSIALDENLLGKFERGERLPQESYLLKFSDFYQVPLKQFYIEWLSDKIVSEVKSYDYGLDALVLAETKVQYLKSQPAVSLQQKTDFLTELLAQLNTLRPLDSYRIHEVFDLEYTYESNRIEGNTLTLRETDLVVNEGLTISGKSMREHLEAINHKAALEYLKEIVQNKIPLTEKIVLQLHYLVLNQIDRYHAGVYRNVQVYIKGSKHVPPQPFLVAKQMEDMFFWYESQKSKLHPVVLAAEMHERLVTIHPFIDGNGRTARLLMNFILIQHGFVIANLKGDVESRLKYYEALEQAQIGSGKQIFIQLILDTEKEALEQYIHVLGGKVL